jgi:hypothetical protein
MEEGDQAAGGGRFSIESRAGLKTVNNEESRGALQTRIPKLNSSTAGVGRDATAGKMEWGQETQ